MDYKLIYLARRNPSIRAEDWPRAWRSHAKFVSQFPVIGANIDSMFYCARQLEPMLDGERFDPPGVAVDYDGVALVSSASPEALAAGISPARSAIDADELRVFSTYVKHFTFNCAEELVHVGPQGDAPAGAAVIRFLARKAGSSREDFLTHLRQHHAEIAIRAANASGSVTRYVHNRLTDEPPPGYPFDSITETWFATADDAAHSFVDNAFAPVSADLAKFCDLRRSVTLLTSVIHRWPRA
jgi:EthD domain